MQLGLDARAQYPCTVDCLADGCAGTGKVAPCARRLLNRQGLVPAASACLVEGDDGDPSPQLAACQQSFGYRLCINHHLPQPWSEQAMWRQHALAATACSTREQCIHPQSMKKSMKNHGT